MKNGFNLADVLMTMIIISVLFMFTIPMLTNDTHGKELVDDLFDFNYKLESSVALWKADIGCPFNVQRCMGFQRILFRNPANFDSISKHMNVVQQIGIGASDVYWLPYKTFDYYGYDVSDYDFRTSTNRSRYLLTDGKIISVQTDPDGFWLLVDVNGKKPPNRIGKDTFHVLVGYSLSSDINYYPKENTKDKLCGASFRDRTIDCNPNNADPTKANGACPGPYTILNHALPDFKSLSETIPKFKP